LYSCLSFSYPPRKTDSFEQWRWHVDHAMPGAVKAFGLRRTSHVAVAIFGGTWQLAAVLGTSVALQSD
jgi:hypothetical protein